jgi:homospermidine synthase
MTTRPDAAASTSEQTLASITGPVVIIGFGSIGRGTLPLIQRHFDFDRSRLVVIDPDDRDRSILDIQGIRYIQEEVTRANYRDMLTPLLTAGHGQGFCINLSVDTSSLDIMRLCRELDVPYIDTVVEPWKGFYFDRSIGSEARTNNALRNTVREEKAGVPGGTTAVSCCGANPGMVSWFVKQALINIAGDVGYRFEEPGPDDREGWARLMRDLGVKGIHIAERDTQRSRAEAAGVFVNTWSVEGFIAEGMQPAELGWGTHEMWMPDNARQLRDRLSGGDLPASAWCPPFVRSWCPTPGSQFGFLVTHNESISIADYFTLRDGDTWSIGRPATMPIIPPTTRCCRCTRCSVTPATPSAETHILEEDEIVDGIDELGVLLYGHEKNAYWYGSQLSIEETRDLAPYQNATGLQVTSAVLAGMVWALENPNAGIVETDEMDYRRCLEIQLPYLGPVKGFYTDWTPLTDRPGLFPEDIDESDPWQFKNVLVH